MSLLGSTFVKPTWEELLSDAQRQASYSCARAIIGGRFADTRRALSHPEFQAASTTLVMQTVAKLTAEAEAAYIKVASEEVEKDRREEFFANFCESCGIDPDVGLKDDMGWLQQVFDKLMTKAHRFFQTDLSVDELRVLKWCFADAPKDDRRYWSYTFQYTAYEDLVKWGNETGTVNGGQKLHSIAAAIFGDAAYCSKQIKNNVAKGLRSRPDQGRPPCFPREVEAVLFRYVSVLRLHNEIVFKSTVIEKAMRLLEGTPASLNFAQIKAGTYVPCPYGGVEWDMQKLDAWFKRRFIGDRKATGARCGNQVLLDSHRAKWHSYEAMNPYFMTHVQALVDEGICYFNPRWNSTLNSSEYPSSARYHALSLSQV